MNYINKFLSGFSIRFDAFLDLMKLPVSALSPPNPRPAKLIAIVHIEQQAPEKHYIYNNKK